MLLEGLLNVIYTLLDFILFFELPDFPDFVWSYLENNDFLIGIQKAKGLLFNYFIDRNVLVLGLDFVLGVIIIKYTYKIIMYIWLNFIKGLL